MEDERKTRCEGHQLGYGVNHEPCTKESNLKLVSALKSNYITFKIQTSHMFIHTSIQNYYFTFQKDCQLVRDFQYVHLRVTIERNKLFTSGIGFL